MRRLEQQGSLVHLMARGIDGNDVFLSDIDRIEFVRRLAACLRENGYRCLAWCLMPNHYHLLVRCSNLPLSKFMRPLNGGYARWFNERHSRRGYLFQDRFKSILCQDLEYARQLVRYIHLNPIRGGVIRLLPELEKWPWCGHGRLIGTSTENHHLFQDRYEALRRFGTTPQEAIDNYLQFLQQGIESHAIENAGSLATLEKTEVSGSFRGWPAVIGDAEFAQKAMREHEVARFRCHRTGDYPVILSLLAESTCLLFGIEDTQLMHKGRLTVGSRARMHFCYRAHHEDKIPFHAIARFLGTTISSVLRLARKGQDIHR